MKIDKTLKINLINTILKNNKFIMKVNFKINDFRKFKDILYKTYF